MNTDLPPAERLAILKRLDTSRKWESLDDRRVCVLCARVMSGQRIRITVEAGGSCRLRCATRGCLSSADQWVYPGNPLVSEAVYQDWWRALGAEYEPPVAGAIS
jgi:hypothetical protein